MQFNTEAKRNVYHCQVNAFYVAGKSLELVGENQILACSTAKKNIGLCLVGLAARVAGVQSVDVVVLMWRVVTGFHSKRKRMVVGWKPGKRKWAAKKK